MVANGEIANIVAISTISKMFSALTNNKIYQNIPSFFLDVFKVVCCNEIDLIETWELA